MEYKGYECTRSSKRPHTFAPPASSASPSERISSQWWQPILNAENLCQAPVASVKCESGATASENVAEPESSNILRNAGFPIFLITAYPKNAKDNLTKAERNALAKRADEIFSEYRGTK